MIFLYSIKWKNKSLGIIILLIVFGNAQNLLNAYLIIYFMDCWLFPAIIRL